MISTIQTKSFPYKKRLIFLFVLIFIYFYDWTKDSQGLLIGNDSNQEILIIKIVNDGRVIVPSTRLKKTPLFPKDGLREVGCNHGLRVSYYGGSNLTITVKNKDGSIQTASCKLERKKSFFNNRIFNLSEIRYTATYDGSKNLICESHYNADTPVCEYSGINELYKIIK